MKKLLLSIITISSLLAVSAPALAQAATPPADPHAAAAAQAATTPGGSAAPAATTSGAAYDIQNQVCSGISPDAACTDNSSDVTKFIKQIINVLSLFVGAISVIMIIVGGFRYIVSAGESAAVTGAKNTIMYAVIGLVVALLAQTIVRFVFRKTTA